VNTETGETACGRLTVAYVREAAVSTVQNATEGVAQVVRILILAVYAGRWVQVPPGTQYSLFPKEEAHDRV
jgi:hypothetical protein